MSAKPKIAFFDFTSCEGCQLTIVDLLQTHLGLLDLVEIVQFREAMSEKGEDYLIAFIEGSCTRDSDEARLHQIREQAAMVVALGACAHLGGVNAMKNRWAIENVQTYVYGNDGRDAYESYPARPDLGGDPGRCRDPWLPDRPLSNFCASCSRCSRAASPNCRITRCASNASVKENACLNKLGKPCLGPITRAGCDAICPTYGDGCEGCRGWAPEANFTYMREILRGHGLSDERSTRG